MFDPHNFDQEASLIAFRLYHFRLVSEVTESTFREIEDEGGTSERSEKGKELIWKIVGEVLMGTIRGFHAPNLFRRSLFIGAFSLLEHQLNIIAERMQFDCGAELSLDEIRGSGIVRAQTYIKKVIGHRFPDTSPEWAQIKLLLQLRNALVHRYGVLDVDGKDARLAAGLEPLGISLVPYTNSVWLPETFGPAFIDILERFLADLCYRDAWAAMESRAQHGG